MHGCGLRWDPGAPGFPLPLPTPHHLLPRHPCPPTPRAAVREGDCEWPWETPVLPAGQRRRAHIPTQPLLAVSHPSLAQPESRRPGSRAGAEPSAVLLAPACAGSGGCGGARCAFTWRCPCGVGGGPRRPGRGCRATCASTPSAEGERAFQAAAWLLPSRQRGSALPRRWGPSYSSSSLLFSCQP